MTVYTIIVFVSLVYTFRIMEKEEAASAAFEGTGRAPLIWQVRDIKRIRFSGAENRVGMIYDILRALGKQHINVLNIESQPT